MRKYWHVFKVALAERFVYRADFFISTLLRFTPIITTIALWKAIYAGADKQVIGNLSYGDMVSYYLLVMVVRAFGSMPGLASGIAADVREGTLRKFVLQPVDYLTYQFALRAAHKAVYFAMAALPYALVFYWCRSFLPGWPTRTLWPASIATCLLTLPLGYLINAVVGLLSFWFLEVTSFLFIFMVTQYFLSGHQFPLSMLPARLERVVNVLPFAYETFHPVMLLLGKYDAQQANRVLMVQAAWIAALSALAALAWKRGLRRYSAFGG